MRAPDAAGAWRPSSRRLTDLIGTWHEGDGMKVTACRICASTGLEPVLDLGDMPQVNYFLSRDELAREETKYPLRLCACQECGLVMLDEIVPAERQYREYHYLTSASPPLVEHFAGLARDCHERGWLPPGARVLDIGANDGTLLNEMRKLGARPLGVDPSRAAVKAARERGIPVLRQFFSAQAAARLRTRFGTFGLITCTNVFAHIDDVKDFLGGVVHLLDAGGIVVMEFAHLLDVIVKNQFDVIYHEHVSYFSLRPLTRLFHACGLEIFDARKVATQGGSMRIYVRRMGEAGAAPPTSLRLAEMAQEEDDHALYDLATLRRFASAVERFRADLREIVSDIRSRRMKIVGLGAPAKGVVLLNFCGVGARDVEYLVDSTGLKQGRYLPGAHIPIYPEEALGADTRPCDYFLLLSWNFQDALMHKIAAFRANGAKVIVPFPRPHVV
jgi:2-polyprenyl-3-methyl-5-hydroxy-6-metoxy-1,4-benzoquinol methylase